MASVEKMDWNPKFSVDINEIDTFQKTMFELFNQLIELKNKKKESKDCINQISEINEFSKVYFSTEEKILKKSEYPDFSEHSKAHRQFNRRFISLRRELAEDVGNLTDEVIEDLRQWLITHILELDSQYVPFLRITDFIEKSKYKK